MDRDDVLVGRVLSRRELLELLAMSGAAAIVGCRRQTGGAADSAGADSLTIAAATPSAAVPACVVKPQLTVGPYFVDAQLNRSDVRTEPSTGAMLAGLPLALAFQVSQIANGSCSPLAGAMVDIWQCDAEGRYSGVNDQLIGFDTRDQKFLRGYQVTGTDGMARFTTIYPGWYQGRTVHIHFKIRTSGTPQPYEFTSQLFFDDALSDRVFTQVPYAAKGQREMRNEQDFIFQESKGQLLLAVAEAPAGYSANFGIALDLSDAETGKPERSDGPEGRGRPGGPGRRGGPPRGGRPARPTG